MLAFTFRKSGTPSPGIEVRKHLGESSEPSVLVGEPGRGRWATYVPVGVEVALGEPIRPLVSVGASWRKGRGAVLVPHTPSDRAMVLVPDLAGYRGGCSVYALSMAPRYYPVDDTGPGRAEWVTRKASAQLAVIRDLKTSAAHRGTDRPESVGGVTVLAGGYAAQGGAGAMGGGPCYLAVLEPGEGLLVVRSGRLYGDPQAVACRWSGTAWDAVDHVGSVESGPEVAL